MTKPSVIWAVGDGGTGFPSSKQVAALIEKDAPDQFIYLGDVYEDGTPAEYENNYHTVFGNLKPITKPVAGNHDYHSRLSGWNVYWNNHPTYYKFQVGSWQFIVLDTELKDYGKAVQQNWLVQQISRQPTVVCMHRSRYSCGGHEDQPDLEPIFKMFRGRTAVFLTGHNHTLQRLTPMNGVTQFVVGSCGHQNHHLDRSRPVLAFGSHDLGALRLELYPDELKHQFINIDNQVIDEGTIRVLKF